MYLSIIAIYVIVRFYKALSIFYFADDFSFLKIAHLENFVHFFNPIRETFYRPLATEVFYTLHNLSGNDIVWMHGFVFVIYLIGVKFLYELLKQLGFSQKYATLFTGMYAIHFTHVYQLYWFATFQEIVLFFGLTGALLYAFREKFTLSILFFLTALLSKETSLVFVFFYCALIIYKEKHIHSIALYFYKVRTFISLSFFITAVFSVLYVFGLSGNASIPEYAIQLNPSLFVHNTIWYALWSIGAPSFSPDYMQSLTSLPLPQFWNQFMHVEDMVYISTFLVYAMILSIGAWYSFRKDKKSFNTVIILSFILFMLPLFPSLFIVHKWMTRLTIPLVGSLVLQMFFMKTLLESKKSIPYTLGVSGIVLYVIMSITAVPLHEKVSTYERESTITHNAKDVLNTYIKLDDSQNTKYALYIYDDSPTILSSWNGVEKLKTTFSDQSFLYFYYGDTADRMRVYYGQSEFEKFQNLNGEEIKKYEIPSSEFMSD